MENGHPPKTPRRLSGRKSPEIFSWELNPFEYDFETLVGFSIDIFQYYNLLTSFQIDMQKFRGFLTKIKSTYHNNPFHNFQHVWSVFQVCFLILQHGADRYLQPNEVFTILLTALCHDLDHPGNNNAFEKSKNSALFQKYQTNAVLECHHKWMAHQILSDPQYDLLSEVNSDDRDRIFELLDYGIMSTDMALHFSLMEGLEAHSKQNPPFDISNPADRKSLVGLIVHCADISGQALNHELAMFWGKRVTQEFINQSEKERELKLALSPWMLGLEEEIAQMKMQKGFVETFIIPQWTLMATVVPALQRQLDNAKSNHAFYTDRWMALEAEKEMNAATQVEKLSPASSSASKEGFSVNVNNVSPSVSSSGKSPRRRTSFKAESNNNNNNNGNNNNSNNSGNNNSNNNGNTVNSNGNGNAVYSPNTNGSGNVSNGGANNGNNDHVNGASNSSPRSPRSPRMVRKKSVKEEKASDSVRHAAPMASYAADAVSSEAKTPTHTTVSPVKSARRDSKKV